MASYSEMFSNMQPSRDLYGILGIEDPRKKEAMRMGLLQAGLGMLANSYVPPGYGALAGIGAGGLQGVQAYQKSLADQDARALRSAKLQMAVNKFNQQAAQQEGINRYRAELGKTDPSQLPLFDAAPEAYIKNQFERNGTPTGFTQNPDGTITPMPISGVPGVDDYLSAQVLLAQQKASIPNYGEDARLSIAEASLDLRAQEAARRFAAMENTERMQQERLDLQKQAAIRAKKLNVPQFVEKGYRNNIAAIKKIDETIASVKAHPDSFGLKYGISNTLNQRLDPEGVTARGNVANVGSLTLVDRTGTAQGKHELKRVIPFIPDETNTPESIVKNLEALKQFAIIETEALVKGFEDTNKYRNSVNIDDLINIRKKMEEEKSKKEKPNFSDELKSIQEEIKRRQK